MKKKTVEQELREFRQGIVNSAERWNHLRNHGGSDPCWNDGCNMNFVRSHIIIYKRNIARLCEENNLPLPDEYDIPTPPEVDRDYMARTDEICENAKITLEAYRQDKNYQYLVAHEGLVGEEDKKTLCLDNVINYARGLRLYIEEGDLIAMRRHESPQGYLDSFQSCRERLEELLSAPKPEKIGQLSIFDLEE